MSAITRAGRFQWGVVAVLASLFASVSTVLAQEEPPRSRSAHAPISALTVRLDSGYVPGFGRLVVIPQPGNGVSVSYDPNQCSVQHLNAEHTSWSCTRRADVIFRGDIEPALPDASSPAVADDGLPVEEHLIGVLPGGFSLYARRHRNRAPRVYVTINRRTLRREASCVDGPTAADLISIDLHPDLRFNPLF